MLFSSLSRVVLSGIERPHSTYNIGRMCAPHLVSVCGLNFESSGTVTQNSQVIYDCDCR